jgi:hypothetical protein
MLVKGLRRHHLDDPVVLFMIVVKGGLIPDSQADQQRYRHPNGQSNRIDQGIPYTLHQVSPGDNEIVTQHADMFIA